ncbi:STAS domain-containing protein [Aquisalimonas sp. 2447]|uniref:STAS domain-containing protein n=1 Tax=Aquisalimonas sp. 2447 TaxID=2740807 RepID=UPI00143257E8|nr:STAS domain-containing protein [Aquisalimonas sp. 2447]QIT57226.1 STAS domain-containing protein [Aquisalimonas sp. 2447]
MPLTTSYSDEDGELIIRISGQFDFGLHRDFRDAYRNATGVRRFVVDLADTEYMDSSALGMLLLLREHAESHSSQVELRNVSGELERILRIANFHQLFPMRN